MYRFALRFRSPIFKRVYPAFPRLIYTDEYLGISEFRTWKDSVREELTTAQFQYKPSALKSRIQASAKKGLLISEDLKIMISMANCDSDVADCKTLLKRYVELNRTNAIVLANAGRFMDIFYRLCHIHRLPYFALDMFNNPVVDSSHAYTSQTTYLILLDLLHKTENHRNVFEVFNKIMNEIDQGVSRFDLLTVVFLSLNKLGEDDAFSKASSALNTFYEKNTMDFSDAFGRGSFAYALLASKAGEYGLAYDAMSNKTSNSLLKNNIELDILTKLGRLSDAINLLHNLTVEVDAPGRISNSKPIFCADIVESLVAAVKESNDTELVDQVRVTFKRLDSAADVVDKNIEYFLYTPIDKPRATKRRIEDEANNRKNLKNKEYRPGSVNKNNKFERLA